MKLSFTGIPAFVGASVFIAYMPLAHAAVVEVLDLNIINDTGNASDGLRFLDMSYSVGLSLASALTNAQATYPDARLASASEWDDLFTAAVGLDYDGILLASAAFATGDDAVISSGANYDAGALLAMFGATTGSSTLNVWSDPDSDASALSTRDFIHFTSLSVTINRTSIAPPNDAVGWFIVSEASAVPIPAAGWLFISAVAGLIGKKRLARQ